MQDYRSVSKRFIILSVFYIVAGFTMLFWPHLTIAVLGKALGITMLVIGLGYVVFYFTKDHLQGILEMDLTVGVVLAAFGAFILLHSDFVGISIPFAVGVVLMIGGIAKIQFSLDLRTLRVKRWNVLLVFSVLIILCGIILIYNPFKEALLIYFIALCLILDGILSIISILTISHRMKMIERGKMPSPSMHGTGPRGGGMHDPYAHMQNDHRLPIPGNGPQINEQFAGAPHVDGEIMEDR